MQGSKHTKTVAAGLTAGRNGGRLASEGTCRLYASTFTIGTQL